MCRAPAGLCGYDAERDTASRSACYLEQSHDRSKHVNPGLYELNLYATGPAPLGDILKACRYVLGKQSIAVHYLASESGLPSSAHSRAASWLVLGPDRPEDTATCNAASQKCLC